MFEWDEEKRLSNLAKHKLDFIAVSFFFDGRPSVTSTSNYSFEVRSITTAINGRTFYTVVWTWRQERRRIISFRRARHGEERAYRQIHG
ncbi:MAG: BrnT family toxin [Chlorobium sp.]|jgi:uncharacterized DUF497 family protein|nr:BrnT family toxin [Chlorobium sp.]